MLREPKTITVDPESALGRLLGETASGPVILEMNGVRYQLSREDELWPEVSEEEYQKILDDTIGSWSDVDANAMIEYLYRARAEGSRPADRPYDMFRDAFGENALPAQGDERKTGIDV